ncbi:probable pyruvate decarboxylase [Cephalotrichum gorgonifer]|uniref:Pyruvate decarboxylase n=1 Tax=Cephalotrichum gorgonifer TaxID=2041049 RepID=A0AAE8SU45_9PEZI|nr:probable pyruvate decarboxylase [Cephalotrichum gorgonifer]
MSDIRTNALREPVEVVDYLFRRLHQLGVRSVHGLPGDYNLVALDYLPKNGLTWVGSTNELNAAYAADGYARVNGLGALITTFGVGELSALNGVAGAFSEQIPLVHIVGTPSTISQRNGMLLHHTLGNGDFNVFTNMSENISCEVAKLNNPAEIADQIDHTLRQCWLNSRPVYITLPTDRVTTKIEGDRLRTPIDLSEPANDPEREEYVVDVILRTLYAAKDPIILVDSCTIRHRVVKEVTDLINKTNIPFFMTPMGKGALDESDPRYGGIYAGSGSDPEVRKRVEDSDLILFVGALKSDFNTAGFSYRTSQLNTIHLHSRLCAVRYAEYPGVRMRGVLQRLTKKVDLSKVNTVPVSAKSRTIRAAGDSQVITHDWFWPKVSDFLRKRDIVVTETGTANFGILGTTFPPGVVALNQVLWGSIGWSVGAAQGAALASKDAKDDRRTVLFVGDGSFQLTVQELSTMLRHGLKPIIFLICNEGFTIERLIHGMEAEYNDIVPWDFKELVTVFGGSDKTARKIQIKTRSELEKLFKEDEFNKAAKLQFVEVYMPKEDAPAVLVQTAEQSAKLNSKLK